MDAIAREYLLIALAIDEIEHGIVDSYFGPPEIRDEARRDTDDAATLAGRAAALRRRLTDETVDEQRALWLERQLLGLETIARRLAGEEMSYLEEVEHCFDALPTATSRQVYEEAHRQLDELLPAGASLRERLDARDQAVTIPSERLLAVADWLTNELQAQCARILPIPAGESLTLGIVTGQPWGAYNWYEGNLRSRIEINADLPKSAYGLIATMTHEAFPGHHLEHASKEARLVRELGRFESSAMLINTPEAYISEGLAEVGARLLADADLWPELLLAICEQAGVAMTPADARRDWQIVEARRALRGDGGDAALMLHSEGRSRDDVVQFLVDDALLTRDRAEKVLEFVTHPLWRTYVFCYAGGEQLLGEWVAQAGDRPAQHARFLRLLTEQLTPSGIAAEITY